MSWFKNLFNKAKIDANIPDHYTETLSQYSTFPRFYYINQKMYDIDSAESILQIPVCKTEFIINDESWSIDGILRSHVNQFLYKIPSEVQSACYEKINQYRNSEYFTESPTEKKARLKQESDLQNLKEKLEKISPEDMNSFNLKQFVFKNIFYYHGMARMLIDPINQPIVISDIEYMNTFIQKALSLVGLKYPYKIPIENISFSTDEIKIQNESYIQYYSFFECTPYTPTGKKSKFPLILHFATDNIHTLDTDNKYLGEVHYMQNGSIGKARLICLSHYGTYTINLSIIKNDLDIRSIEKTSTDGVKTVLFKN